MTGADRIRFKDAVLNEGIAGLLARENSLVLVFLTKRGRGPFVDRGLAGQFMIESGFAVLFGGRGPHLSNEGSGRGRFLGVGCRPGYAFA